MPVNKGKAAARKAAESGRKSLKAEAKKPAKVEEEAVPVEDSDSEESGNEDSGSEESGSEESGSEESDNEEEVKSESAKDSSEESGSEEENDNEESEKEDKEEESESESSERGEKRKAEEELEEAKPKKTLKIEKVAPNGTSDRTIFIGSLDFNVTEDEVKELFSKCGNITGVRMSKFGQTNKNKGTCYMDFETEAGHDAALKLNGTELRGRSIRVDHAAPSKKESLSTPTKIVFVANLPFRASEEEIEATFSQFGEVANVTLLTHGGPEQKSKGIAYVEFTEQSSATKAVKELENTRISSRPLRIDYAQPRGSAKVQKREPKSNKKSKFAKNPKAGKKTVF